MLALWMSRIEDLEQVVHCRGRNADSLDDTYFGVHEKLLYARAPWTGIVTIIAIGMLKSVMAEAVICVQSYAYESPPLTDTMDYLRCDHTVDCKEELKSIENWFSNYAYESPSLDIMYVVIIRLIVMKSADLVSPATCLEENENGFVKVKSKREELINALECNESFLYIVCAPYGLLEHENGFKRQDAKELFNHRHSLLQSFTDRTLIALKEHFPILMSAPSYHLPTQVMLV
ncbi:hypothetical protein Tco_1072500, partial [Tanacetum coccineum]